MNQVYDVIILGAGPAGLSAGLYAGRSRLTTLLIEKSEDGGQIVHTSEIENYPGALPEESGPSLIQRMSQQTEKFGVERVRDTVLEVKLAGETKEVKCRNGVYLGRTVILALGASPVPIDCPGEREFTGKGVSYCATCDGAFFEDMEVYVVGGGDAAVEEAMFLAKFARSVTVIHRRDQLRAAKSIQEKAFANPKMHFMWDSVVKELQGDGLLQSMVVENVKTGERRTIEADPEDGTFGVFVFIGFRPNTELLTDQVKMEKGYILTDDKMCTDIPGVFAAGDIRVKSLRQVVTATADGAIAAVQAGKFLEE